MVVVSVIEYQFKSGYTYYTTYFAMGVIATVMELLNILYKLIKEKRGINLNKHEENNK